MTLTKWRTTEQREIKPIVIWQNNWLLCNTMQGATASARLYLIIDTAKTNNLKIYDYLVGCLKSISKRQTYPNIYACKLYCEAWSVHISGVNVCIKKMTKNVRPHLTLNMTPVLGQNRYFWSKTGLSPLNGVV